MSSRSGSNGADPRFDGGRIAAGAGALAVHAVVLMLVLAPMKLPPLAPDAVRLPDIEWLPRDKPEPVEMVPFKPDPVPVRTPVATVTPPTPVAPPVAVDPQLGDIAVAVASEAIVPTESIEPAAVMTGATLRYAVAPPPPYPARALRRGLEGTVVLEVLVDTDGRPLQVTVSRSSGHRELDRAALRHVLESWRFQPALRNGRPVQAIGLVPIGFALRG